MALVAKHHPPDHKQEVLRRALFEARQNANISPSAIIKLCNDNGFPVAITPRTLQYFIANKTKDIGEDAREALAGFWVETVRGRALRTLGTVTETPFLQLIAVLGAGNALRPNDIDHGGRYYLYHGSYLDPEGLVIRALEIKSIEGQLLLVTDHVRDTRNPDRHGARLQANGAMTFEGEYPQIVLHAEAEENKRGLSMILFDNISYAGRQLASASGALMVHTTGTNTVVSRRCILVREAAQGIDAMREESELVSYTKLASVAAKHEKAFQRLAGLSFVPDPILKIAPPPQPKRR